MFVRKLILFNDKLIVLLPNNDIGKREIKKIITLKKIEKLYLSGIIYLELIKHKKGIVNSAKILKPIWVGIKNLNKKPTFNFIAIISKNNDIKNKDTGTIENISKIFWFLEYFLNENVSKTNDIEVNKMPK